MPANQMKKVVESIMKVRGLSDSFTAGECHTTIFVPGFDRLAIERHGTKVTVSHYFEKNGDLIPEPDMEFHIEVDGSWTPVAIQHSIGPRYVARKVEDGRVLVCRKQLRDQSAFANMWARNIKAQGFIKAD